ncbi:MAG: hypothetical protein JW850_09480 [Thermoflexales bacterium]|nr:hypothetical protein [Thermoflexales bacterium]
MHPNSLKSMWLRLALEMSLYGGAMAIYFLLVLRFLGEPLLALFRTDLLMYAIVGLVLIAAQGLVLAELTSFLMYRLFRDQHEQER